jgi:hypothetical protein
MVRAGTYRSTSVLRCRLDHFAGALVSEDAAGVAVLLWWWWLDECLVVCLCVVAAGAGAAAPELSVAWAMAVSGRTAQKAAAAMVVRRIGMNGLR